MLSMRPQMVQLACKLASNDWLDAFLPHRADVRNCAEAARRLSLPFGDISLRTCVAHKQSFKRVIEAVREKRNGAS